MTDSLKRASAMRSLPIRFRLSPLVLAAITVASAGLAPARVEAAVYYVAPDGNDTHDGLASERAWRSLQRVNTATLVAGDQVLFRRGGQWRGQLLPQSGSPAGSITYGAYGQGPKPSLLGSAAMNRESDWKPAGAHRWTTSPLRPTDKQRFDAKRTIADLALVECAGLDLLPCDVGNIIFDHGAAWGVKKWNPGDLQADRDYWYDPATHRVELYLAENPARRFKSVELALCRHIILQTRRSYVSYENLDVRYGAAHGIGGGSTHHIAVRDCDFSWIGGGHQFTLPNGTPVRFGNGVEFWGNAHDCVVERCRLWEIYDAALTNQNKDAVVQEYNLAYRHNLIWNCEYSFEYWNAPEASQTHHVYFEHNTCYGAGYGWGHSQRPNPAGRHLCFYPNPAQTHDLYIRNNIFCQAMNVAFDALWWKPETMADRRVIHLDHNCWFQPEGTMIRLKGKSYAQADFAAYQRATGQEAHSRATDPALVDPARLDFHLRPGSPCIDAGAAPGSATDSDTKTSGRTDSPT